MEISEELLMAALSAIESMGGANESQIGEFVALYNSCTGQCKRVVLHRESGIVFKETVWQTEPPTDVDTGGLEIDGVWYPIRYAETRFFNDYELMAQEYVPGKGDIGCPCGDSTPWCSHAYELEALGFSDPHTGNWKIHEGVIVMFDW